MSNRKRKRNEYELHKDGFEIHRKKIDIPDNFLQSIRKQVIKKGKPIFNHNHNKNNDCKRLQCNFSLKTQTLTHFIKPINNFLQNQVNDKLQQSKWVILYSKPGCQVQAAHSDYIPDQNLSYVSNDMIPLLVIISLQPETKINVWPRSIHLINYSSELLKKTQPILGKEIHLEIGDILVFRADLIHAGSQYQNENIRLHCYLDSPVVPRIPNRTWIIDKHASEDLQSIII